MGAGQKQTIRTLVSGADCVVRLLEVRLQIAAEQRGRGEAAQGAGDDAVRAGANPEPAVDGCAARCWVVVVRTGVSSSSRERRQLAGPLRGVGVAGILDL